ncbi:endoplasmic reticulum-Golgi intermediate compartment protein 2-like isoform X2 [Lethenteron reissneri]|uniref:endoplasmic reticulum-Golgi intermediate compartment protein 2-like isoform X2 n=1 Tax=Lethenteron reissneri TaxID=7753 RepID=UPI002AB69DAE|nr:endoplasmic reticulum-Golgi intermediate compartment protein 2-like isoform X2 [Lethenteron reissneri]
MRRRRLLGAIPSRRFHLIKELDAFPKLPEGLRETSALGAAATLWSIAFISLLLLSEFREFRSTHMRYSFRPDHEHNASLLINVDITVAMACKYIGGDAVDLFGNYAGSLNEEPAYFDLSENQRRWQERVQALKVRLAVEQGLHDVLFKEGFSERMPPREESSGGELPDREPDACRIHGTLITKKVPGNFHIVPGKSRGHRHGHAHILHYMLPEESFNFSHRIDELSFGQRAPGIVNALDGDARTATREMQKFQYFLQVVPTCVRTRSAHVDTHQYSVTEQHVVADTDYSPGRYRRHTVPGIFVRFSFAPLRVLVAEESVSYAHFAVRLCGLAGGIFQTLGTREGGEGGSSRGGLVRWRGLPPTLALLSVSRADCFSSTRRACLLK